MIRELRDEGLALHISGDNVFLQPGVVPPPKLNEGHTWKGEVYRFGALGDTHYGSKYAREDIVEDLYRWYKAEGIERVYHTGNWIDGEKHFNKQDLLPEAHGLEAQLEYFIASYPKVPGIKTFIVSGDDHEGWYCFGPGVEIFTSSGWVDLAKVKEGQTVAGKDADGRFVWQPVLKAVRKPHKGSIVRFADRSMDFEVTPDHRFEVFRKASMHGRPVKCVMTAAEIVEQYKPRCIGIPRAAESWLGVNPGRVKIGQRVSQNMQACRRRQSFDDLDATDAALLCAWFTTEGSTHNGRIYIGQSAEVNPDKCAEICALLDRLGIRYSQRPKTIDFSSPDLEDWLKESCGVLAANKRLPAWIKDLPEEDLAVVFDALIKGDGHERESGWRFYSKSEQLRADVTEIAQKLGYTVTEIEHEGLSWKTLSIGDERPVAYLFRKPEIKDYDGDVFCVSVPTERIFVRKQGKTFWSMNCQSQGVDIGRMMQDYARNAGREDLFDLGYMNAYTRLIHKRTGEESRLLTSHPGGGSAYATSYAIQKIAEGFAPGQTPGCALFGHYHKMEYLRVRGCHAIQTGCTKGRDPWSLKMKLSYHLGGVIVELRQAPDGSITDCLPWFRTYSDGGLANFSHSHSRTPVSLRI